MSKIICDVCGTRYPESAEQCPICGCTHTAGVKTEADSVIESEEVYTETYTKVRGGRFSKSNVRKRNKNIVYAEMDEEDIGAEETVHEEIRRGSNGLLNFLLVLVIIALLVVSGYIFYQHFLPDILADMAETTEPTVVETIATEEPTIPCENLVLADGFTELNLTEIGATWPLAVEVVPADSTDTLSFSSSDSGVFTVDEQGVVTAVGYGEAVMTISCGPMTVQFKVVCAAPETEAPTTAPTETVAPTEAPTEPVELKVDRTDMTFREINQQTYMKVYNGLSATDVTWTSKNPGIIKVDANGLVTCVGWGTTRIIASYGAQEVEIICRCIPAVVEGTTSATEGGSTAATGAATPDAGSTGETA